MINSCGLSMGYQVPCKQIAGIKEIYLAVFKTGVVWNGSSSDINKVYYHLNNDGSINQIDNIQHYYKFEVQNETASLSQAGGFSVENNTSYYTKTLEFVLHGMEQSLVEMVKILGKGNWSAIVVDQSGLTWLVDMTHNLNVIASTPSLGKAYGDLYGTMITMETKGSSQIIQLEDGLFPSGLGCPILTTYSGSFSPTDPYNNSLPGYTQALFYFTPQLNSDGSEITYDISIYFTISGIDYLLDSFTNINRGWETSPYYDQPFPWPFYAQYSTLLSINAFSEGQTYKYVITPHGTEGQRNCSSRTFLYSSNCPVPSYTYFGSGDAVGFTFNWTTPPGSGFDYSLVIYVANTSTILYQEDGFTTGSSTPAMFDENVYYDYIIYPSLPVNNTCGRRELIAEI